jgi:hypothetical protein
MKILLDAERLRRRARLAHSASLGGMLAMLVSVAVPLWRPSLATACLVLLMVGLTVSMLGIGAANRWVKRPRPEEVIRLALKGLAGGHRLYHYLLPADHVLLTPSGVVVIHPVTLDGAFTYRGGRWHQRFSLSRATRFLVEPSLGDPTLQAKSAAAAVREFLGARLPHTTPPISPVVLFTHPGAVLDVAASDIPVCLPEWLRKRLPQDLPKLSPESYAALRAILDSSLPAAARSETKA